MKPFETIKLAVPIVLIKEGSNFIVSCDTLGVYSQSSTVKKAQAGFSKSLQKLFEVLLTKGEGVFESYLWSKQVISVPFEKVEVVKFPNPELKLGVYQDWYIPAKAIPRATRRFAHRVGKPI